MWGGLEEWVKKVKGIKRYQLPIIKLVMGVGVKYSIRNIVSDIVITLCAVSWVLDISAIPL